MSVEWDDGEKSALSPYTEGNKLLNISWLSKPLQLMVFLGCEYLKCDALDGN